MSLCAPRTPQTIYLNSSRADPSLDFLDLLGHQLGMVWIWLVDYLVVLCCIAMVRALFLLSSLGLYAFSSRCHRLCSAQMGLLLLPHLSPRFGSIFWVIESLFFLLVLAAGEYFSLDVKEQRMWITLNL